MPSLTDWIQAVTTVVLVALTFWYQRHEERSKRDRATPYLSWQEPRFGVATDLSATRVQLDIVLWNIGGSARVLDFDVRDESGLRYFIDWFDKGSLIPAPEQLTLHVYKDEPVSEYVGRTRELTVSVDYEDPVTGAQYLTVITLAGRLGGVVPGNSTPELMMRSPIPDLRALGAAPGRVSWLLADRRTPAQRRVGAGLALRDLLPGTRRSREVDDEYVLPALVGLVAIALFAVARADVAVGLTLAGIFAVALSCVALGAALERRRARARR